MRRVGNTTLRITSRQGLQLHGVLKQNLHETIRRINEIQLSTLAACGDVKRNVMCCPAPYYSDPVHAEMQALADRLAEHLTPRTRPITRSGSAIPTAAKSIIWAAAARTASRRTGTSRGPSGEDVEPIYGQTYLPRKFKMAVGLPGDNCVDLYANDLGLMAICRDWRIVGYNVLVGGGLGVTPSAAKTFPAVAKRMASSSPTKPSTWPRRSSRCSATSAIGPTAKSPA